MLAGGVHLELRFKRLVPAALQLASDQTIGRVDSIVLLALGSLVTRPLQCQLELPLCG
ncbi:hypothetical protein [Mesorhizobium sp. M0847]|uniref:hypothetical protein n=1 Tax=unclassified Mesorhizobium TaxID=325217 RepID=UPI00333C0A3A